MKKSKSGNENQQVDMSTPALIAAMSMGAQAKEKGYHPMELFTDCEEKRDPTHIHTRMHAGRR